MPRRFPGSKWPLQVSCKWCMVQDAKPLEHGKTQTALMQSAFFGPSGATRTPGLLNPNQARYQLRYTRIFNFCHYITARGKIKVFSVCGHLCGQSRFYTVFGNRWKSRKCRCHKALRRFALPCPGYCHGTPKCGTVPTPPYPDRGGGTPPDHGRRTLTISDFLRSCKGEISRSERPSEPPHGR